MRSDPPRSKPIGAAVKSGLKPGPSAGKSKNDYAGNPNTDVLPMPSPVPAPGARPKPTAPRHSTGPSAQNKGVTGVDLPKYLGGPQQQPDFHPNAPHPMPAPMPHGGGNNAPPRYAPDTGPSSYPAPPPGTPGHPQYAPQSVTYEPTQQHQMLTLLLRSLQPDQF